MEIARCGERSFIPVGKALADVDGDDDPLCGCYNVGGMFKKLYIRLYTE